MPTFLHRRQNRGLEDPRSKALLNVAKIVHYLHHPSHSASHTSLKTFREPINIWKSNECSVTQYG